MKLILKDKNSIRVIADSAIARNRLPWFKPDVGNNWHWRKAVAYRVSKLGKNIAPQFISRYIDTETLLWVAEADNAPFLDFMDGAVVCGAWTEIQSDVPAEILAELTKCATIKNGDIIAFMLPEEPKLITINQHISLQHNNQEVLSFNIK